MATFDYQMLIMLFFLGEGQCLLEHVLICSISARNFLDQPGEPHDFQVGHQCVCKPYTLWLFVTVRHGIDGP